MRDGRPAQDRSEKRDTRDSDDRRPRGDRRTRETEEKEEAAVGPAPKVKAPLPYEEGKATYASCFKKPAPPKPAVEDKVKATGTDSIATSAPGTISVPPEKGPAEATSSQATPRTKKARDERRKKEPEAPPAPEAEQLPSPVVESAPTPVIEAPPATQTHKTTQGHVQEALKRSEIVDALFSSSQGVLLPDTASAGSHHSHLPPTASTLALSLALFFFFSSARA